MHSAVCRVFECFSKAGEFFSLYLLMGDKSYCEIFMWPRLINGSVGLHDKHADQPIQDLPTPQMKQPTFSSSACDFPKTRNCSKTPLPRIKDKTTEMLELAICTIVTRNQARDETETSKHITNTQIGQENSNL